MCGRTTELQQSLGRLVLFEVRTSLLALMLLPGCFSEPERAEPTGTTSEAVDDDGSGPVGEQSSGGSSLPPSSGSVTGSPTGETDETAGGDTTGGPEPTSTDPTADDTGSAAESDSEGGDPAGRIDVELVGCAVDFGGEIVVSFNGSLGVGSIADMGGLLTGSLQFALVGPDTFNLSTQHRVDTDTVINMVDPAQGTWTNLDADALSGGADSIGGVLAVTSWNPARGEATIEFQGVTLQNVVDQSDCTIDGTVEAYRLHP